MQNGNRISLSTPTLLIDMEMEKLKDFPVPVTHLSCGRLAFWGKRMLEIGEEIRAEDFSGFDGRVMAEGTEVICGSCGRRIELSPDDMKFDFPS